MWIIDLIPTWIVHLTVAVSLLTILVTTILTNIIPVTYNLPLKFAALVLCVFGVYLEGSISNQESWQAKIAEEQIKVAQAEAKSAEVNTVVVTKILTKTIKIKDDTNANQQYIAQNVAKDLDSNCKLTNAAVVLVNAASKEEVPGSTGGVAQGTSDVKASDFLSTVNENYGTYYQVVEQVKGWQEWYRKQKKIFEE
jgi:hypothetical protein